MSWNPEVLVENKWCGNGLYFATKEEAEAYGRDLLMRWWVPVDSRAVESDEPVNYRIVDGVLESLPKPLDNAPEA